MPLTDAAMWLNDFFFGYDHALLSLMHSLAAGLGGILTPLTRLVTLLGEHGIVFYVLAVFCALFADRRDTGVCIFGAVCCGALITNIILKDNTGPPPALLVCTTAKVHHIYLTNSYTHFFLVI